MVDGNFHDCAVHGRHNRWHHQRLPYRPRRMALAFLGSPPFSFILTIKLTGILAGINFFMVILFFPETRYVRKLVAPGIASETSSQEGDSKPAVQVDIEPANATPTSSIPKKTFL